MKKSVLPLKEVKSGAGMIPTRITIMLSLIIFLLIMIPISQKFSKDLGLMYSITAIYWAIAIIIAILVWRWGSNQFKYQTAYLREVIMSHESTKETLDKEKESIEERLDWHQDRVDEAKRMYIDLKIV